jgi:hypothetical protein
MATSGIPSARKKLDRATVHLAELKSSIDDFRESTAYEFTVDSPAMSGGRPTSR